MRIILSFFNPPEDLQVGHELNGFNLTTEKQLLLD